MLSRRRARERALRPRSGPSEVAARWPSVDLELTAARWRSPELAELGGTDLVPVRQLQSHVAEQVV